MIYNLMATWQVTCIEGVMIDCGNYHCIYIIAFCYTILHIINHY
jgi:hypothetical protein